MFTTRNTGSKWNMIKYFSEYSHGTLDLTGTQIFGWFKLDKSVADYNGPNGGRTELIKWARKAATDNGVDLSLFFSTIVCCNRWKDIGSVGSGAVSQGPLTLNPQLLGHEMGHVYGMNHSRGSVGHHERGQRLYRIRCRVRPDRPWRQCLQHEVTQLARRITSLESKLQF